MVSVKSTSFGIQRSCFVSSNGGNCSRKDSRHRPILIQIVVRVRHHSLVGCGVTRGEGAHDGQVVLDSDAKVLIVTVFNEEMLTF